MSHIVREIPGLLSPINGVAFHALGEQSISEHVADALVVDQFTAVPGYRLAEDDEVPEALRVAPTPPAAPPATAQTNAPAPAPTAKPETKAQKAARELAEKAEQDRLAAATKAQQAGSDGSASEDASSAALTQDEAGKAAEDAAKNTQPDDEVF